jgi:hypothetical protein
MFEKRVLRGLMLAIALALLVALMPSLALADKGNPPGGPSTEAVGHTTINGNPLTIHVAADTSIQVFHSGLPNGQVYPSGYKEADSGGFAWLNRMVFGPDFANHGESAANFVNPWLPAGPQTTMGAGTTANPWWVGTTVWGPAPISVQQWVRYVDGEDCFRVSYLINDGEIGEPLPITFFQAADLHVGRDDDGFGYYAGGGVGAWSTDRTFLEYMVPVTEMGLPPASHYQEAGYQAIWDRIGDITGPGAGFNDTVRATPLHDSGCGLQWDLMLPGVQPPGNFVELALDWCFVLEEEPPPPEFVPEPGSLMLLASGLAGLAGYAGLRARKR